MKKVCVLGSLNMDLVLNVDRMPKEGETILSNSFIKIPGGKGANQAVAAKRLGAEVHMVGKVGADEYGSFLRAELENDDINVEQVYCDKENSTGLAIISVDLEGNNSIILVSGSNMNIKKEDIEKVEGIIADCDTVIAQLETPVDATIEAFKLARKYGVVTLLNPAPARDLPEELIELTDIIVPNETEFFEFTKVMPEDLETAKEGAKYFLEKGVQHVIITLGSKGAALISKERAEIIAAYKVNSIDTTAAGDAFIGALTTKLEKGKVSYEALREGIQFANKVSSIVVQRKGAQPSLPTMEEVIEIYGAEV